MPKIEVRTWQAETLRLTAFPREPVKADQLPGWSQLLAVEPEISQSLPRQAARVEAGPYQSGVLSLEAKPARIDWKFSPQPNQLSPSVWDTVGELTQAERLFTPLMKKWLRGSPPLSRLAFGAVLVSPVDDIEAGYRLLTNFLPHVQIDPKGSSDFLYQINRRRMSRSGVRNLEINRLSKWSVAARKVVMIESMGTPAPAVQTGDSLYACRLELDINSVPKPSVTLKKSSLSSLLDELIDVANELALEGDKT